MVRWVIRAASVRFMPSSTAASDNNRRLWLLSFERWAIGNDEKIETPKTPIKAFDIATAFSKCVWFKKDQL
jgi:hypothetical protein